MRGIFYDSHERRVHRVQSAPHPGWVLVTHNLSAGVHQCRRIMQEWLGGEELFAVDWSAVESPALLSA